MWVLKKHVQLILTVVLNLAITKAGMAENSFNHQSLLTVGIIDYAPFVDGSTQPPKGILIEYVDGIFNSLAKQITWQPISILRAVRALKEHEIDVVLTMFKTDERETVVRYSDHPLMSIVGGICVLANMTKIEDHHKMLIAHVEGTVLPKFMEKHQLLGITPKNGQHRMLEMLRLGRVDAIYSPNPMVFLWTAALENMAIDMQCYEISDVRLEIFMAFSHKLDERIVAHINKEIALKNKENNFDQFLRQKTMEILPANHRPIKQLEMKDLTIQEDKPKPKS